MKCPTILRDGRCATSRQPANACPVHGQRRNRTVRTEQPTRRTVEDAAEAAWWQKNRCTHRGDFVANVGCATCKTFVASFACALHGTCTELRRATNTAIRWCGACSDHAVTHDKSSTVHSTVPVSVRPVMQPAASGVVTVAPVPGIKNGWEGTASRKPWEYRVQVVIAHWNTPDVIELGVRLWRAQTVRPLICIVDTGSSRANLDRLYALEAEDVEVHSLRARGHRHSSGPVAAALDLAAGLCQQQYQFHTHTDVYPRRQDLLEWLIAQCDAATPVVGYEMSPRDFVNPIIAGMWRGMVGHTATMLHWPTIDRHDIRWHMEASYSRFDVPREPMNNTDTETAFNLRLQALGITPKFVGHDTNFERYQDENIDHFRSHAGSLLYAEEYHQQASEWARLAMKDASERLDEWHRTIPAT